MCTERKISESFLFLRVLGRVGTDQDLAGQLWLLLEGSLCLTSVSARIAVPPPSKARIHQTKRRARARLACVAFSCFTEGRATDCLLILFPAFLE